MKNVDRKLLATLTAVAIAPVVGGSMITWLSPSAVAGPSPQTTNIAVSATVAKNCTFQGGGSTNLAFGSYDPTAASALQTNATVNIRCTKGTVATIGIDYGLNNSSGQRRMTDGSSNYLNYQVYTDSGYANIWTPVGGGNDLALPASTGASVSIPIVVYGSVPASQDATFGSYTDTLVMTASF